MRRQRKDAAGGGAGASDRKLLLYVLVRTKRSLRPYQREPVVATRIRKTKYNAVRKGSIQAELHYVRNNLK